jgi:hypothetical protein
MHPLATMTCYEYNHVIGALRREGLGYRPDRGRAAEHRANVRAVEILTTYRRRYGTA